MTSRTFNLDWKSELFDLLNKEDEFIKEINQSVDPDILKEVKHHYLSVDQLPMNQAMNSSPTMNKHGSSNPNTKVQQHGVSGSLKQNSRNVFGAKVCLVLPMMTWLCSQSRLHNLVC